MGPVQPGANRWVQPFLNALSGLPEGLKVGLDNGVRCPFPKTEGSYSDRAVLCVEGVREYLASLEHPDSGCPGIVICDRDLAAAYADLELLRTKGGDPWQLPKRFIAAVGEELTFHT